MHHCSFYCQDGLHVQRALARPTLSPAQILAAYQAEWRLVGPREVVAVRPAREADTDTWAVELRRVCAVGASARRRTTETVPDDFVPYLVFWKEVPAPTEPWPVFSSHKEVPDAPSV